MKEKSIIVGVTGGIAAYKSAELVRLLVKEGARVKVAMTSNATRFVAPLTFEALSGNRVIRNMWEEPETEIAHICWGQESDLVIIAPATANFIAKMACGLADDFLSTMVLAATADVLLCPAMNSRMFVHPATRENMARLKERGVTIMAPGEGALACRTEGPGRLPDPEQIVEQARMLLSPHDLTGLKILVTAGPTVEPLDPVRYFTNRSSGKMGYALARAATRRGASVTLVSGPTSFDPPFGVTFHAVRTAEEMKEAVLNHRKGSDIIVKAAAVADYRPKERAVQKIKKENETLSVELVKNPDILAALGQDKEDYSYLLVGFAAETQDLLENARKKLKAKNLDLMVANDVTKEDAGFESDTNRVKLLFGDGRVEEIPLMNKTDLADLILDRIKSLRTGSG
jgi:phosphopantothenoylcysteine decarboxylase / phosphopantothenate---cysteine ligase